MSDNFLPVRKKFKFRGSMTRLGEKANQSRVFQFLIDGLSSSASIYRLAPCLSDHVDLTFWVRVAYTAGSTVV